METSSEKLDFISISALYLFQTDIMASYGIILLGVLVSSYLLFPKLRQKYTEFKNIQIIKSLGKYQLRNIEIQINQDETVYIDHLILIPKGIFVLNILKYNGIIFAGDKVEQWTQLVNKKSYKFQNPLHDLDICISAIRGIVKNCDVVGHIAFESNCQFPKGKPAKISLLHEMQNELEFLDGEVTKHLEEEWNALKDSNMCISDIKQKNLKILVNSEQKSVRNVAGILLLTASLLMFIYRAAELTYFESLFT